ncbi:rhamnulokinase [Pseudonocardia sp. DR1-2]|uniref:rhamnulokinase n=1 Tax=Pseudonocardia sp. DR1-2 TaxID=2951168 RepID=UPI002044C2A6|nr:rhamnulokinase family protein [Pseudonocardia sp. DR1-2]MCM3848306.1 rhamnulokinase [Pseudonocardia sp. DR1-2]
MRVAAVDLGASSGRVMACEVSPAGIELTEVHRFPNGPVRLRDTLHWDVLGLYRGVLDGLAKAGPVEAVGIDSWAVDYGLLDASGALLGNPVHYRDSRTDGVAARVPDSYATTGVQVLPFNTVYQLVAAAGSPQRALARELLLIPDLLGHWLTGARVAEVTNASTTGLLDVHTRDWARGVMTRVGIEPDLFPPLVEPGTVIGSLPGGERLVAVGSHDTASAVVGVPADTDRFAYVATGTWSLVGLELHKPVTGEDSRTANFSNELGVDGTVRYLRNVMGLWLLQECLREWGDPELGPLLEAAAAEPGLTAVVDAGDPAFIPPGDMPARIAAAATGPLTSRAAVVRCIMDSLALAHRRAVRDAIRLSGQEVDVVHVVGGGARNTLLCALTADACGLPVLAGPVEAAAYGNALVQARALGALEGGLTDLRAVLRGSLAPTRHEPTGDPAAWDRAESAL